jgi:hypothetical protein
MNQVPSEEIASQTVPLVTVGVPVWNGARFLHDVFPMLRNQSYPNLDILVADNASTDETEAICREYQASDSRIRYTRHERNLGMTGNFNFLLDQARGKYFMFAAVDDCWAPTFVETCVRLLESDPTVACAFPMFVYIDKDGHVLGPPQKLEYPAQSTFARLAHFAAKYQDHCFYGLLRTEMAGRVRQAHWWSPLKDVLHDNVYPFVCGLIAGGRVVCPSESPLYQVRIWPHEYAGEHYFPKTFPAYLLLKLNVLVESLKAIFQVSKSWWLAAGVTPFFFMRMLWECVKRPRYMRLAWWRIKRRFVTPARIWLEQHIFWRYMTR